MKLNSGCFIVSDLLPSYIEGLTSEATGEWMAEHLKNCKKCRKQLQMLEEEQELQRICEERRAGAFRRVLMRYQYQLLGVLLGFVLVLGVIVLKLTSVGIL